jgi:lactoylglutathione lyase
MPKSSKSAKKSRSPSTGPEAYLQSVAVVVSDRARAKAWYSETLGLDVLDDDDHWVTVGRKGRDGRIHLCQTSEFETNAKLEPGNTGILLLVPGDFQAECARWKEAGVEFSEGPAKASWGWYAVIKDPDGNEFPVGPADT